MRVERDATRGSDSSEADGAIGQSTLFRPGQVGMVRSCSLEARFKVKLSGSGEIHIGYTSSADRSTHCFRLTF